MLESEGVIGNEAGESEGLCQDWKRLDTLRYGINGQFLRAYKVF